MVKFIMTGAISPTTTFVAEAPSRVGKVLLWAAEGPMAPAFTDPLQPARWRKPSEFGGNNTIMAKLVKLHAHDTPNLESRYQLRLHLAASTNKMLCMGVPKIDTPLDTPVRRTLKTMEDAPSMWLR